MHLASRALLSVGRLRKVAPPVSTRRHFSETPTSGKEKNDRPDPVQELGRLCAVLELDYLTTEHALLKENPGFMAEKIASLRRLAQQHTQAGVKEAAQLILNRVEGMKIPEATRAEPSGPTTNAYFHKQQAPLLESEVGQEVRDFLDQLRQTVRMDAVRDAPAVSSLNMLFIGGAGVGKASTAMLVANVLHEEGILKSPDTVSIRAVELLYMLLRDQDLTAFLQRASGKVLFIDEAHLLATPLSPQLEAGNGGATALDLLLALLEPVACVAILALYPSSVKGLLRRTPGLRGRFPIQLTFRDFDPPRLAEMMRTAVAKRHLQLSPELKDNLASILTERTTVVDAREGNAHLVSNLLTQAVFRHALRLKTANPDNLKQLPESEKRTLTPADFGVTQAVEPEKETLEDVLRQMDRLIGQKTAKAFVHSLVNRSLVRAERRRRGIETAPGEPLHMVFRGPSGTGKTTFAHIVAKVLKKLRFLKYGQLVTASRQDFVAQYLGQSAHRTMDLIYSAMGGVLFVDEAYSLVNDKEHDPYGKEALTTLMDAMEVHREDFVVILAGYPKEMDALLRLNPGLLSRIPLSLDFQSYLPAEIVGIAQSMFAEATFQLSDEALDAMRQAVPVVMHSFSGNARFVRNFVRKVISEHNRRTAQCITTCSDKELITIQAVDVNAVVQKIDEDHSSSQRKIQSYVL